MQRAPFTWREELAVFFAPIDRQHKEIVTLAGHLHAAFLAGTANTGTGQLLAALSETTRQHFISEEGFMLASGYPGYAEHRAEHQKLLEQLEIVARDLTAGHSQASEVLAAFVKIWVEQHILFSDKPLAAFLIRTGFPASR